MKSNRKKSMPAYSETSGERLERRYYRQTERVKGQQKMKLAWQNQQEYARMIGR